MKVPSGYDSLSYSGIFCFGKHPSLLKFIQKMNPSKWFIYDQCPGFFFCIFCAFFLQTLWTSVPLCLQYYGIDFCTFPQVLVLLLQCEKKHGGQISFLPSKLPACPLPSPCPTPIFLSKNSVFSNIFFPSLSHFLNNKWKPFALQAIYLSSKFSNLSVFMYMIKLQFSVINTWRNTHYRY